MPRAVKEGAQSLALSMLPPSQAVTPPVTPFLQNSKVTQQNTHREKMPSFPKTKITDKKPGTSISNTNVTEYDFFLIAKKFFTSSKRKNGLLPLEATENTMP